MDSVRKTETADESVRKERRDRDGNLGWGWGWGTVWRKQERGQATVRARGQGRDAGKLDHLFTTLDVKMGGRMSVKATKVARSTVWFRCSSVARGPAYHTQSPSPLPALDNGVWRCTRDSEG